MDWLKAVLMMLFAPKKLDKKKLARFLKESTIFTSDPFTLTELQEMIEWEIGYKLEKRNFRRRIKRMMVLKEIDKTRSTWGRSAQLYVWQLHDD